MSEKVSRQLFDLESPLSQAGRCLDLWLAEEGLSLDPRRRRRAIALIARYFHNEENLSDQLVLSFLRHFSGFGDIDMDDAGAVRREVARLLKGAIQRPGAVAEVNGRGSGAACLAVLVTGVFMIACGVMGYEAGQPVTLAESVELRQLVDHVVDLEKARGLQDVSHQRVWADLKRPLAVSRYQDMSRSEYRASRKLLEQRLRRMNAESSELLPELFSGNGSRGGT